MLKRTLVTVAGATALVAASFGTPAFAEEPPVPIAGCGKGQTLVDYQGALHAVDWSIYQPEDIHPIELAIAGVDGNGDGHFCIMTYKPSNGRDRQWATPGYNYEVTKIGDNKSHGQLG
jgi:hypothetical protein